MVYSIEHAKLCKCRVNFLHSFVADRKAAFRVGFEMSAYAVLEGDREATVCMLADHGSGSEVYTVSISTVDITTQGWYSVYTLYGRRAPYSF